MFNLLNNIKIKSYLFIILLYYVLSYLIIVKEHLFVYSIFLLFYSFDNNIIFSLPKLNKI